MELVDEDAESPTLISNVEVMELLKKNIDDRAKAAAPKKKNNKRNKHFRHRDWVEEEVHRYLTTTPCVKLDPRRRQEFHSKLKSNKKMAVSANEAGDGDDKHDKTSLPAGFGLTEAEALQIMNMMPTEPVEIHLMVDELQSRMTETRQEEFLACIGSYSKADNATDTTEATRPDEKSSTSADIDMGVAEKWIKNGSNKKNGKKKLETKIKQEDNAEDESHRTGAI